MNPRRSRNALSLVALAATAVLFRCALAAAPSPSKAEPRRMAALPGYTAPSGYTIDSLDAVTPRPTWEEAQDGDFTYSVRREAADSTERRLLRIAEAVYPSRRLLAGIAARSYYETGSDTAGVPLWWCQGIGARRIPYAVTAGAMEHYLGLTKRFRAHHFWETGMGGGLFWTDFVYHARIDATQSFDYDNARFPNVYVATIVFGWGYDDGTFVPITQTTRTVVLSPRGDVLQVNGDGTAEERVTLSAHRGIGHVDHIFR